MDAPPPPPPRRRSQFELIGIILVLAVASAGYRLVYAHGLQRSAVLYIGVPMLLALGMALIPSTRSATGMVMRGAVIALAVAGIVLPEGLLCIAMAAPFVLGIALVVGLSADALRSGRRKGPSMMVIALPLVALSLEGVGDASPVDPRDRATATAVVDASPDEVAAALASPLRFGNGLPPFLTLGFNRPRAATGSGLGVGDRRTIEFDGGTHDDHPLRLFGGTGERSVDHHSTMELSVTESEPGRVTFAVDHDGTMLGRWLDLDRAVVEWQAAGSGGTRVSWTLEYERLLFPSYAFGPMQRYGMDEAAGYLLDRVVVDRVAR